MPDLDEMPETDTHSHGPTPDKAPCSDWNPLKEDLESWTDMSKWAERRQQQKKINWITKALWSNSVAQGSWMTGERERERALLNFVDKWWLGAEKERGRKWLEANGKERRQKRELSRKPNAPKSNVGIWRPLGFSSRRPTGCLYALQIEEGEDGLSHAWVGMHKRTGCGCRQDLSVVTGYWLALNVDLLMFLGVRRFLHSWTWCTDQNLGLFWVRSEYCLCFSFLVKYNCLKYSYRYVCLLPRFVCEIRLLWERGLSNSPTWLLKQLMANHTEEWLQHVARNTTECMSFAHAICWAPGACTGTELSMALHFYSQDILTGLEDMKDSTYGTILKIASTKKV